MPSSEPQSIVRQLFDRYGGQAEHENRFTSSHWSEKIINGMDFVYCPTEDLCSLESEQFDIVINVASIQEMNQSTIVRYFNFLRTTVSEYLSKLFNLKGKTAIVIGGAGYLCSEMAFGLAQAGVDVVLLDKNEEKLKPAVEKVKSFGVQAFGITLPRD